MLRRQDGGDSVKGGEEDGLLGMVSGLHNWVDGRVAHQIRTQVKD